MCQGNCTGSLLSFLSEWIKFWPSYIPQESTKPRVMHWCHLNHSVSAVVTHESVTHNQCSCLLCVFLSCLWWESGVTHREKRSDLQPIMAPQLPARSELQLEYTGKPWRCDHNQVDAHKQSLTVVIKWVVTWFIYITLIHNKMSHQHLSCSWGLSCSCAFVCCFSWTSISHSNFHIVRDPNSFYILNYMPVWYFQTKTQCKGFSN